jgi:hypothetical protein
MNFTANEFSDMHLILGESGNNAALAAITYAARYPGRRHPSVNAIRRVDDRLRQNLAIVPTQKGVVPGRPRTRRTPALEEANPRTSVRQIARELVVPFKIVNRVIQDEHLHPYHYTKVQAVLPQDYEPRMQQAHWLLERNDNFLEKVLWTDEALFTRDGVFNRHNEHYYALENPHVFFEASHQHRFSLNVWAGIVGNHLIGPHILIV